MGVVVCGLSSVLSCEYCTVLYSTVQYSTVQVHTKNKLQEEQKVEMRGIVHCGVLLMSGIIKIGARETV